TGTVLEVVVKADTTGTLAAVAQGLAGVSTQGTNLRVIHASVGEVAKSDLLMAATGGRLVLGFQVATGPKVEEYAREQGVEVRLYDVIYDLLGDAERIARSLVPRDTGERITGRAKVIALFKSTRKGIILGCEVQEGTLAVGKRYRIIDPAGSIHEGRIESLHVGPDAVREGRRGQQVGLKVEGFRKARRGDWVECFEVIPASGPEPWKPRGGVHRVGS
ncbi:MAG: hypothetical protein IH608_05170, partial [Proteobacteria bacterium]|nr:hypothetical protein [Pseudomonadota bacterium]